MKSTTEQYTSHLQALLPQGAAWSRAAKSKLTELLAGFAGDLSRNHNRAVDLVEEADPRTALELLVDWERVCGLPNQCSAISTTIQERRAAVVAKLNERGAQDINYFKRMAVLLGYNVEFKEHRPFVCGKSTLGKDVLYGGPECRNRWQAIVLEARITPFRAGVSQCGKDPLAKISRAEDLECQLHRLKPAQSELILGYKGV
jgi:uncharacterized protein YmfQ (DUF2313 family)